MRNVFFILAVLPLFALFMASTAMAQGETHAPHVHGEAALNVSISPTSIELDLDSPLASFISFEHHPSTPDETKEFEAMDVLLKAPDKLIAINKDYGCTLKETDVEYQEEGHHHEGEEGHHHEGEEGHHHEGEEGHDHEHGEGAVHRELEAAYAYTCQKVPATGGELDLSQLFKGFPLLKSVHVQTVTPEGQKAQDLTPQATTLKW
ncbi:MAG: DUF2796 domain-containing protein [Deltaproteobacteria bacterium]|jgi:hypothetical protein|nr:DUF2796 domain-containing protein [Deltaproteobacteria bacterium]